MTIDDKLRDKKPQYDINRDAAKIYALSSYHLINKNISQPKKYCFLTKEE